MNTIYFVTGNKGKVTEATKKLKPMGIHVVQKDLGYPEIQADSLEEVAQAGVEHVRQKFNHPFMLEDAGLFIDALKGFPGVYSKYVFFTIGLEGTLRLLEDIEERTAVFRSAYAYYKPGKIPVIVTGECHGTITREQRGKNGFGFDPIFIPEGDTKTFGEMMVEEKNTYSHRAKSLERLRQHLE